jgi:hypothetical protein
MEDFRIHAEGLTDGVTAMNISSLVRMIKEIMRKELDHLIVLNQQANDLMNAISDIQTNLQR